VAAGVRSSSSKWPLSKRGHHRPGKPGTTGHHPSATFRDIACRRQADWVNGSSRPWVDLYRVASGWLGRLGADIRIGLLLILTAKRQALAIGYLAKIASIHFERLVDCLIGFGSAGDGFREVLLIRVLGLTWAMAGLYASYQAMVGPNRAICVCVVRILRVGQRPLRIAQRRFDCAVSFNSDILPA
jgi:hypothetical protein